MPAKSQNTNNSDPNSKYKSEMKKVLTLTNKAIVSSSLKEKNDLLLNLQELFTPLYESFEKHQTILRIKNDELSGLRKKLSEAQNQKDTLQRNTAFYSHAEKARNKHDENRLIDSIKDLEEQILQRSQVAHPNKLSESLELPENSDQRLFSLIDLNLQRIEELAYSYKKRLIVVEESQESTEVVLRDYGSINHLLAKVQELEEENEKLKQEEKVFIHDAITKRRKFAQMTPTCARDMITVFKNFIKADKSTIDTYFDEQFTVNLDDSNLDFDSVSPDEGFKEEPSHFETTDFGNTTEPEMITPIVENDDLNEKINAFKNVISSIEATDLKISNEIAAIPNHYDNRKYATVSHIDKIAEANEKILAKIHNASIDLDTKNSEVIDLSKKIIDMTTERKNLMKFYIQGLGHYKRLTESHIDVIQRQTFNKKILTLLFQLSSSFGLYIFRNPLKKKKKVVRHKKGKNSADKNSSQNAIEVDNQIQNQPSNLTANDDQIQDQSSTLTANDQIQNQSSNLTANDDQIQNQSSNVTANDQIQNQSSNLTANDDQIQNQSSNLTQNDQIQGQSSNGQIQGQSSNNQIQNQSSNLSANDDQNINAIQNQSSNGTLNNDQNQSTTNQDETENQDQINQSNSINNNNDDNQNTSTVNLPNNSATNSSTSISSINHESKLPPIYPSKSQVSNSGKNSALNSAKRQTVILNKLPPINSTSSSKTLVKISGRSSAISSTKNISHKIPLVSPGRNSSHSALKIIGCSSATTSTKSLPLKNLNQNNSNKIDDENERADDSSSNSFDLNDDNNESTIIDGSSNLNQNKDDEITLYLKDVYHSLIQKIKEENDLKNEIDRAKILEEEKAANADAHNKNEHVTADEFHERLLAMKKKKVKHSKLSGANNSNTTSRINVSPHVEVDADINNNNNQQNTNQVVPETTESTTGNISPSQSQMLVPQSSNGKSHQSIPSPSNSTELFLRRPRLEVLHGLSIAAELAGFTYGVDKRFMNLISTMTLEMLNDVKESFKQKLEMFGNPFNESIAQINLSANRILVKQKEAISIQTDVQPLADEEIQTVQNINTKPKAGKKK